MVVRRDATRRGVQLGAEPSMCMCMHMCMYMYVCMYMYMCMYMCGGVQPGVDPSMCMCMHMTPNPNKCTHNLRAISTKIEIISTTRGGTSQKSTDLDSGRRPKLKSVDFCEVPPLVVEICGRQLVPFPKKMYTYWDFGSGVPLLNSHSMVARPQAQRACRPVGRTALEPPSLESLPPKVLTAVLDEVVCMWHEALLPFEDPPMNPHGYSSFPWTWLAQCARPAF